MQDKKYKLAAITILAAAYATQHIAGLSFRDLGYCNGCPVVNRLWYPFFHAGVLHLACNCYALWLSLNSRLLPYRILLPLLLVVSFASSFLSTLETPTVGASSALFAMVGINMSGCSDRRWWLLIIVSLCSGFVIPGVNGMAHVAAFVPAFLAGSAILFYRRIQHDCRAVSRGE
jgi:membrane associated rhomboid family serine protease